MNAQELELWTVEQAAVWLPLAEPLTRAELSQLGRECSMVSRIWSHPTGVVTVTGKPWPTEKSYTRAVLVEVFGRNPRTSGAYLACRLRHTPPAGFSEK